MYEIADEYGTVFPWRTKSYLLACHTAHWIRELGFRKAGVVSVETGRFTSEAYDVDEHIDAAGRQMAKILTDGDFESRLICRSVSR